MDQLQREGKSQLTWAMQNDVELMRRFEDAIPDEPGPSRPETFDFGWSEQMLSLLLAYAQAEATQDRATPIRPRTARDLIKRERAVAAHRDIVALVHRVPEEEYQRFAAEVGPQLF